MYKCLECGKTFTTPELVNNPLGLEAHLADVENVCPYCGGAYDEAVRCEICDEWETELELTDGVCKRCIEEFKEDNRFEPKELFQLADKLEKAKVEINPLLYAMLDEKQIETILINALVEAGKIVPVDCEKFFEFIEPEEVAELVREGVM